MRGASSCLCCVLQVAEAVSQAVSSGGAAALRPSSQQCASLCCGLQVMEAITDGTGCAAASLQGATPYFAVCCRLSRLCFRWSAAAVQLPLLPCSCWDRQCS